MNDDVIQDLKQFITTAISQQTTDLYDKFDNLEMKVDKFEIKLEAKIDDLDIKIDTVLGAVGERFDNHEVQIQKLETAQSTTA